MTRMGIEFTYFHWENTRCKHGVRKWKSYKIIISCTTTDA